MATKNKFKSLIDSRRKEKKIEKFKGTFLDYLNLLEEDKSSFKLAHKRLYDTIAARGINQMDETDLRCRNLFDGDKLKVYDYFKKDFFGTERVIAKVMR